MGMEVLVASMVVSAIASVAQGVSQIQAQREGIKNTREQERYNIEKGKRNAELVEKQRSESLKQQSQEQKVERGQALAQQATSGLGMDSGTQFEQMLNLTIAQHVDTNRLNDKFNNTRLQEKTALNEANYALELQRNSLKNKMTASKIGLVSSVAGSIASISNATSKPNPGAGGPLNQADTAVTTASQDFKYGSAKTNNFPSIFNQ